MKRKIFPLVLMLTLALNGSAAYSAESESSVGESAVNAGYVQDNMFTNRDYKADYDEENSVLIQLNGDSAVCSCESVNISEGKITISDEGVYVISGTLNDGMIIVDAEKTDKLQLVLNNASINSETSAAIYILKADKVFITLAPDTANSLSNGGVFETIDENNIDAAVFSKQDLTFNGSGSLTVNSPAGHGIVSKDDLVFTGGDYIINSASHGIDANDSVRIVNSSITVDSGKDGIHAENSDDSSLGFIYIEGGSFNISAEGDGLSAGAYLQIEDGIFDITSGGGSANAAEKNNGQRGNFGGGGRFGIIPNDGNADTLENFEPRGNFGGGGRFGITSNEGRANTLENLEPRGNFGGRGGRFGITPNNGNTDALDNNFKSREDFAGEGGRWNGSMNRDFNQANNNSPQISDTDSQDSVSTKGIKAEGGVLINGGGFLINSADDGIHSNDSITINGGTFDIASGDDAFHADNELTISSGSINITESYEGLESLKINILGGEINLTAKDDGLNAAGSKDSSGFSGFHGGGGFASSSEGSINIEGGNIYINAYGDGIDANGTLDISGGMITISGPTYGDTSVLDYDVSANITGGTFIGTGAVQMAQTFSSSEQGVIAVKTGNQSPGTEITLTDNNGNTIISYTPNLDFAIVILSSPEIVKGEEYTITVGSISNKFTAS